uniref:ribonuclease H n=1 Tax=Sinocyclocheilus rhinocerous TaxID=307959 RepID=A0A673KDK0_9TELE
ANLGAHDSIMLVDSGACVSITNISLPLTGKQINLSDIMLTKGELIGKAFSSPITILNKAGVPKLSVNTVVQNTVEFTESPIVQHFSEMFPDLWSVSKRNVGLCKIKPLNVAGPYPHSVSQYPLRREAERDAREMVSQLHETGIVVRCSSPTNSPMWPVKKPDGSYRLTIDYTSLNAVTPKTIPIVVNPATIINYITPNHCYFSTLDITNGLPQGYCDSPSLFHCVVAQTIADVVKSCAPSVIIQYCDDILLALPNKAHHLKVLTLLLRALHEVGFLLSKQKAQLPKRTATGHREKSTSDS